MLSSQEQMEIIKGALAEGYKGPIFKLIEQANFKKQEEAAQQEQPEQRKTGGLKDNFEKEPSENPTPISPKTQSSVDNIMSTYFGHLDSTKQNQIANAIFLDDNSIDRTTKLIESGNLESIAKNIGNNPLAARYFKGEDLGLLEKVKLGNQMKPVFKNISNSTGLSGKRLINQVFQDTKDLQKEGFISPSKNLNKTTAFKVAGTLNNPNLATQLTAKAAGVDLNEFSEYTPSRKETGGLVQSYESKPPSLEILPTGNKVGKYDTLENAGAYKSGGFNKYHKGGPAHTHTDPPNKKIKTGVNSFVKGTPIQDADFFPYPSGPTIEGVTPNNIPPSKVGDDRTLRSPEKVGAFERITDILASPTTAFRYSVKNQPIPGNIPIDNPDRNVLDSVFDTVNPFAMGKYASQVGRDLEQGNKLDAAFNTLGAIPVLPAWAKKAELLSAGKNLKNVGKNLNKEAAATKKIQEQIRKKYVVQEQLRKRTTYPKQNSPSPLLPENAPYLSKVKTKIPKDEEVFRSFLPAEKKLKLEAGDIKHFDPQGNLINKKQNGGLVDRKVLYNKVNSKKIKKRKR